MDDPALVGDKTNKIECRWSQDQQRRLKDDR